MRIDEAAARLIALCDKHGLALSETRRYPGFRQFEVASSDETTKVDIVYEPVPQSVQIADKPMVGRLRIDDIRDLTANKLGAVLGRGDPKDLVDLYFLDLAGFDVLGELQAARRRDAGMEPATLAWVLNATPADPSHLMLLVPVDPNDLERFRDKLIDRLQKIAWPETPA